MGQSLRPFSAYAAAEFASQFDDFAKVYSEAHKSMLAKYKDEEGKIPEDKEEEANKDFQELLNIEIEFEMLRKIKLTDSDDIKITPNSVMLLKDILEITE